MADPEPGISPAETDLKAAAETCLLNSGMGEKTLKQLEKTGATELERTRAKASRLEAEENYKDQLAERTGLQLIDPADRMFEALSGISVNVDMVTLHFKDGSTKQFRYIQPKQIHRKRKETT